MTMLQRRAPDTMHQRPAGGVPREPGPERQSQTILPAHRRRHEMLDDAVLERPSQTTLPAEDFTAAAASLSQRILRLFLAQFLRVCAIKRMAMLQRRDSDAMLPRTVGGEPRDSGPAQSQPTLPMDMGRHAMLPRALRAHEDVTESRPADLNAGGSTSTPSRASAQKQLPREASPTPSDQRSRKSRRSLRWCTASCAPCVFAAVLMSDLQPCAREFLSD